MRKLIVSMNLSLDGYLARPDGALDWHVERWTDDMAEAHCRQLAAADTILLGRITYERMVGYWCAKTMDSSCVGEEPVFADMMQRHTKIVVSRWLNRAPWGNTIIWPDRIAERLRQWKEQHGRDIILYGSNTLLTYILPFDLIDEYRIWLHPVAIGKGRPMFDGLPHSKALKLAGMQTFCSGVVLLSYQSIYVPCRH